MMELNSVNSFNHPSAAKLINERIIGVPVPNNSPVVYSYEISKEEKELYDYLWTMYRYEIDNELTRLDFKVWIVSTKSLSDKAALYLKEHNPFEEKFTIIQPLPSRILNLTSGLVTNHVVPFCVPFGDYDDISVTRKIQPSLTYAAHLLLQNDQSLLTGAKIFEAGKVKTLTHIIYGNSISFPYYHDVAKELRDRLTGNNQFYAPVDISEEENHTQIYTYRRY